MSFGALKMQPGEDCFIGVNIRAQLRIGVNNEIARRLSQLFHCFILCKRPGVLWLSGATNSPQDHTLAPPVFRYR